MTVAEIANATNPVAAKRGARPALVPPGLREIVSPAGYAVLSSANTVLRFLLLLALPTHI